MSQHKGSQEGFFQYLKELPEEQLEAMVKSITPDYVLPSYDGKFDKMLYIELMKLHLQRVGK